jgi:tRNA threonylcarbamoyladenosine biosynthesis protein TsaB
MISAALAEAGLSIADIDRFAVTTGPGSFTGIRVGIAAVRGFALATGKPAVGFSTLALYAAAARSTSGNRAVMAALEAKGGEVYAQLFDASGFPVSDPSVADPAAIGHIAFDAGAVLAGSGADAVVSASPAGWLTIAHRHSAPDMRALLDLASNPGSSAAPPRPLYIRAPDAVPAAPRAGAAP